MRTFVVCAAVVLASLQVSVVAGAQEINLSGGPDASVPAITTAPLGMTGWGGAPVSVTTSALGMTGWRSAPVTLTTAALGMTGWRSAPIKLTTPTLGMTGWKSSVPEGVDALVSPAPSPRPPRPIVCQAPLVPDPARGTCVCREGFEQRGNTCVEDRKEAVGGLAQPPEKPEPPPLPVAPAPQPAPDRQPKIQRIAPEPAPQPQPETRRVAPPPSAHARQAVILLPDLQIRTAAVNLGETGMRRGTC